MLCYVINSPENAIAIIRLYLEGILFLSVAFEVVKYMPTEVSSIVFISFIRAEILSPLYNSIRYREENVLTKIA